MFNGVFQIGFSFVFDLFCSGILYYLINVYFLRFLAKSTSESEHSIVLTLYIICNLYNKTSYLHIYNVDSFLKS